MSLFDRLKNKRYDLQEKKKEFAKNPDEKKNNKNEKPEIGRTTYNKNQKLDQEISQTRSRETLRRDQINKQYGIDGGMGDTGGSEDGLRQGSSQTSTTERPKKREVKKIMNKSIENQKKAAERAKTFRQSFGTPTGADPKTGKPFYGGSTVSGKAGPDIDLPKGRGGGIPTDKAYEKQAKRLGDREAAKKTYIDPKTYKASKEGTKAYIRKSLQMKTGSNVPVDEKEVNKIFKKSGKEYADKINQKYGGKRTRVEREIKTEYQKELDRKAKSSKKFGGKPFDDLISDARKKNKKLSQELKTLNNNPIQVGKKVTAGNQIAFVNPPPFKSKTKSPPLSKKSGVIFPKKIRNKVRSRSAIGTTLALAGAAYLLTKGNKPKPKNNNNKPIVPPPGKKLVGVKQTDSVINLAGPGGGRLNLPAATDPRK